MKKAYLNFLRKPDSISITSYLSPSFNLATIAVYDTEQWVSLLGLSLKVNNQAVTPFEINIPAPSVFMDVKADDIDTNRSGLKTIEETTVDTEPQVKTNGQDEPASGQTSEQQSVSPVTVDQQPNAEKTTTPSHHQKPAVGEVPVSHLPNYIGRQINVTAERSKRFSGELLAVDREALTLKIRVGGGTVTMPIRIQRIKSVEAR